MSQRYKNNGALQKPNAIKIRNPKIIFKTSVFNLLICRGAPINYRKLLFNRLNEVFSKKTRSYNTWKSYFLYPEKAIPQKLSPEKKQLLLDTMEELLYITFLEQCQFLNDFKSKINKIYLNDENKTKKTQTKT